MLCQAQGTLNLKSIAPALLFLAGLFCYDVYFVFLAPGGVMESVATSVEVTHTNHSYSPG